MRVFIKWPKRVDLKWKRAQAKEIEIKLFTFTSLLDNFWILDLDYLTHVPVSQNDLSRKFQRSYLSGGLSWGSMLCFIMVSGMITLTHVAFEKEARKLLISLEVKN